MNASSVKPPPAVAVRDAANGRGFVPAAWVVLALALAFSTFVRVRLIEFPLERDEGEYAYAGQLILQNVAPYSLAYNMKLPGTYLAYAGMMAVFGQTTAGIHMGLLVVNLATIVAIFFFARELFDPLTAAVAAVAYSVMSASSSVLGMAAHATHFVTFFGIVGAWVLWRAMQRDKAWLFSAAGVLLGIAFLMKQQGVFLPCFGGLATLVYCLRRRPILWRRRLATCLGYAAGVVLPYAAVCLWLWLAGTFDKFWFWTVEYARAYVGQVPPNAAIGIFWKNVQGIVGANWPLWALAAVGVFGLAMFKGTAGRRGFFFTFIAFSFLCVCPGFYFRQHYFIVFLPCVAILAGIASSWLMGVVSRLPAAWLATLIPAAAVAFPIWQQRDYYFFWSPEKACRRVYGANPFIECPVIAEYLKKHSRPYDRVVVLGSEPEIYFYAERISATGYIYTYALMELHPLARTMQEEMIREIEAAKPKFLVFVDVPMSWLAQSGSDLYILEWLNRYVAANYRPVGLADILSEEQTEYKWDTEVISARPRSRCHLWVFRRKP